MKTPADSLRSIRTTVPTPGSAEFTAQRQQLAQLIGRLRLVGRKPIATDRCAIVIARIQRVV